MTSQVPELQNELLTLLVAAFPDSSVHFAPPAKLPAKYELVHLNGVRNYTRGAGEQYRAESAALSVVIEVFLPGDDPQGADTRRWAMIDTLDDALIDADLGGYGTEGGTLTDREPSLTAYDKGWVARSVIDVTVEERS